MKRTICCLVFLFLFAPLNAQSILDFNFKVKSKYDGHSKFHAVRGFGIGQITNTIQFVKNRKVNYLATRLISLGISVAFEAGQMDSPGGWFDPLDILFDLGGTELSIWIPWKLVKQRKVLRRSIFDEHGLRYKVEVIQL